jgi:acyl dehydratase
MFRRIVSLKADTSPMQDKPHSPVDKLHLEDLEIGRTIPFGHKLVTKDEIVAFARAYDPQLIHLDEEVARKSIVGGLCASGFHSCAMFMRMLADDVLNHSTSLGSPGMDEVKWMKPVRPGDVLSGRYTCTEKRALGSRPEVGLAKVHFEMLNQKDETVMSWDSNQLLKVRHPLAASTGATRANGNAKPAPLSSFWEMSGPPPSRTSNHFEDRVIGEMADLGSHTFAEDEIIAFAREYDPQPFHIDAEAAKSSLFGALCASGWHTAAHYIRLSVALRQKIEAEIAAAGGRNAIYGPSPGFKNVRWLKPVYVDDTIAFRTRTSEKIELKSRPDRGLMRFETQGRNQNGEIVFAITGQILVERREPYRA